MVVNIIDETKEVVRESSSDPLSMGVGKCSIIAVAIRSDKKMKRKTPSWRNQLSKFRDVSIRKMKGSGSSTVNGDNESELGESIANFTFANEASTVTQRRRPSASSSGAKTKVKFVDSDKNTVQTFERCSEDEYSSVWWSKDEITQCRSESRYTASKANDSEDGERIQNYLVIYQRVVKQVQQDHKLSSENLLQLVSGLSLGYRGLETYCPNRSARKKNIANHVLNVCAFYSDQICNISSNSSCRTLNMSCSSISVDSSSLHSLSSASTASSMNSSYHSMNSNSSYLNMYSTMGESTPCAIGGASYLGGQSNSSSIDRSVRSYSCKSSSGNRHVAIAMGRAEGLAACEKVCDLQENVESALSATTAPDASNVTIAISSSSSSSSNSNACANTIATTSSLRSTTSGRQKRDFV